MSHGRLTIADVARAAGVSTSAVSFALNDRPGVAAKTRERILATAKELGWTPSHRARALSANRALALGLVLARSPETLDADPFFPAFLAGIETVLAERGQELVLHMVGDSGTEVERYRRLAADRRVDGVFLTDMRVDDPRPALLAELRLPSVVVGPSPAGRSSTGQWQPSVSVDDRPGITAAVEHLVALGHRRIAHVAGPARFVHGASRRDAWAAALQAAGLPQGPLVTSDFSALGGAAATKELLDSSERPTAVVYANDLMAIAGMSVALAAGVELPAQLSITGFDDTQLAAHLQPSLTTVRTDAVGWGRASARHLLAVVDGEQPDALVLDPPRLVVRASTVPPAAAGPAQPPALRRRRRTDPPAQDRSST